MLGTVIAKPTNPPVWTWFLLGAGTIMLALPIRPWLASPATGPNRPSIGDREAKAREAAVVAEQHAQPSGAGFGFGSGSRSQSSDAAGQSDSAPADPGFDAHPSSAGLVVGTFNLQWALDDQHVGIDPSLHAASSTLWQTEARSYAEVIRDMNADIVAVQEIGGEREMLDIVRELESLTNQQYNHVVKRSNYYQKTGLIWRRTLGEDRSTRQLVADPKVLSIELAWQGKSVTVVSLQFSQTKPDLPVVQAQELSRAIEQARATTDIVLVAGDVQYPHDVDDSSAIVAKLADDGRCTAHTREDPQRARAPTAHQPDRTTDYVFVCGDAITAQSAVVASDHRPQLSDHHALALTLAPKAKSHD